MKLVRANIVSRLNGWPLLLIFCLCAGAVAGQQHGAGDTLSANAHDNDSAGPEYHDRSDYFDPTGADVGDTIRLREVPASDIDSLKKDDAFWYADRAFERKKEKEREVSLSSRWMNMTTLVVIVVIFAILLGWYLIRANVITTKSAVLRGVKSDTDDAGDIFKIDFEAEIRNAVREADYRMAVRLMFLRALKRLSDEDLIVYKSGATNLDYLRQLNGGEFYSDFFRLTRTFEYAWYGKFDIGGDTFRLIEKDFNNFNNKLS